VARATKPPSPSGSCSRLVSGRTYQRSKSVHASSERGCVGAGGAGGKHADTSPGHSPLDKMAISEASTRPSAVEHQLQIGASLADQPDELRHVRVPGRSRRGKEPSPRAGGRGIGRSGVPRGRSSGRSGETTGSVQILGWRRLASSSFADERAICGRCRRRLPQLFRPHGAFPTGLRRGRTCHRVPSPPDTRAVGSQPLASRSLRARRRRCAPTILVRRGR
jgi:hypothetical protein